MSVSVGAIGFGGLAQLEVELLEGMPDVEIGGGVDRSPEARELFESVYDAPAYESTDALLEGRGAELDAAIVVTPHTLHYGQTKACLDRGLHVLVEKPMVTEVEHAIDLVETAAERELVLQVGYQRHFHPGYQEVRRLVTTGRIGPLHTVNCALGQEWIRSHRGTWRVDPELSGGGQLYDTGSHLLDALLWTTDSTPRSVTAQLTFDEPRIDVNSAVTMELERDDRPVIAGVTVSGDGLTIEPYESYAIWGEHGRVTYQNDRIVVVEEGTPTYETHITEGTDFRTLTRAKLENFVASVRGEAEPAVPGEIGMEVTAVTEAIYRAAEQGERIDVESMYPGTEA